MVSNILDSRTVFKSSIFLIVLILKCAAAQRDPLSSGSENGPSNYKDALLVYPTGIRSERDLPVCPTLLADEEGNKDVGPSFSPGLSNNPISGGNDLSKLLQPSTTKNPSESSNKYLAACNIIHKRYFFPPMIERLCRCPDRTECPMEWSHPPQYKDLLVRSNKNDEITLASSSGTTGGGTSRHPIVSTTPSTKYANTMDPFTVMISSRSQLKFCTEISAVLPTCEKQPKSKDSSAADQNPSMVKTIRKTLLAPELPSVAIKCYCPPLYRGWTYLSKTEPLDHGNSTGTATTSPESNYFYRCDKLRKCKSGQQCGMVRTDFHFSYYHCICPKNHLCVPKVYPPVSTDDVIDGAEEALFSGQAAPAFCTLE